METFCPCECISGPGPALHPYFDLCPESTDGRHVVYFSFDGPVPGPGRLVVQAHDGSGSRLIGPRLHGIAHAAARQQWVDAQTVAVAVVREGAGETLLLSIADGSRRRVPGVIRMAAPDGSCALTADNEWRAMGAEPPEVAVWRMVFASGTLTRLFGREELIAAHPRANELRGIAGTLACKHTKWNPDSRRFFHVFHNEGARRKDPSLPRVKSLMLAQSDGSGLRYVDDFGTHPFWGKEGRAIWSFKPLGGDGMAIMEHPLDGGKAVQITDPVHGNHGCLNPAGTHMVMDHFDREQGTAEVNTLCLETGELRPVARFAAVDLAHATGTHPHPTWSRDGRRVYFNAAEQAGHPRVYRAEPGVG
jgi:hypothetical protein